MGPSGSGTTTLGKKLSRELSIAQEDSDNLFWENTNPPFTTQTKIEKLYELFNDFTKQERFILSGDVLNWGLPRKELLNCFTHLIYLYVPWEIREKRIREREIHRFGNRILNSGDMYKTHEGFIEWASHYESGRKAGRNMLSQKNFIDHFRKQNKNVLEIEEPLELIELTNHAISFLNNQ